MVTFDPKRVTAPLQYIIWKGNSKQVGKIYNCQKQSVHKLWPMKYHWFTWNFPQNKFFET